MKPNCIDALLIRIKFNPFFEQAKIADESIGLLSIATYCRDAHFNVRVLNDPQINIEFIEDIIKVDKVGVIGFFVDADNVWTTLSLIDILKENFPHVICVVGGPQISAPPWDEKVVTQSKCNFAVRGEGEKPFLQLLQLIKLGKTNYSEIKGITFVVNGAITRTPDDVPFNLDEAPIPDRTLTYFPSVPTGIETMYTSKGCPYHCAFCFEGIRGHGYRMRSVEEVIKEVEYLLVERKMRYLLIMDNLFTFDVSRTIEICRQFIRLQHKHHNFGWYCEGRANIIKKNPQLIREMIDSGLLRLQIGIESGSQNVLNHYEKALSLDDIRDTVKLCYDAGLASIVGNFIVGGPFETKDTIHQSITFAQELLELAPGCLDLTVSIYGPYPSTNMYLYPGKFGITMIDKDCITGAAMDYVFSCTDELSKWDILKAKGEFITEIELKISSLLSFVPNERMIKHFKILYDLGLYTMWVKVASRSRSYNNYFGSIAGDGKKTFAEVFENIELYKPIRTIPIRDGDKNGIKIILDNKKELLFSDLSSRIYELCSGKILTRQIIDMLYYENQEQIERVVIKEYLITFLEMLDKERLVIFSKI